MNGLSRRHFLLHGLCAAGLLTLPPGAMAYPMSKWLGGRNPEHLRWILKHYLAWHEMNIFAFSKVMQAEETAIVTSALAELPAWDTRLGRDHWIDHVYFGVECTANSVKGGRIAVAVAPSAANTRGLLEGYLNRQKLRGYLRQPGLSLAGAGWDLDGGIFKLYFACDPDRCERADVSALARSFEGAYLPQRWISMRFKSGTLQGIRAYALRQKPEFEAGSDPVRFGLEQSLLQRMDILTPTGFEAPLLRLKSVPALGMSAGVQQAARAHIAEFRFAPDSIRYWDPNRAVLYYP